MNGVCVTHKKMKKDLLLKFTEDNRPFISTKTLDLCLKIMIEINVLFIACIMLSKLHNVKHALTSKSIKA